MRQKEGVMGLQNTSDKLIWEKFQEDWSSVLMQSIVREVLVYVSKIWAGVSYVVMGGIT